MSVIQFYFSNSGEKTNMPGQFRNNLPAPLVLEGEWEAALKEIHFPNSWWTIFKPITVQCWAAIEELKPGTEEAREGEGYPPNRLGHTVMWQFEMPRRHYDTEMQLVQDFDSRGAKAKQEQLSATDYGSILQIGRKSKTRVYMDYTPVGNKFSLMSGCKYAAVVFTSGADVVRTLGIEPTRFGAGPVMQQYTKFPFQGQNAYTTKFGNPGAFLIYWDAIEYSVVGDTQAPLLAVVIPSTALTNEFSTTVRFDRPVYRRVTKSYISEVEFTIYDTAGNIINFNNIGQTTLVVEYRKVWHQQPSALNELPQTANLE